MQKLIDALVLVIEDITNEVGYEPEVKANILAVLANRLHEVSVVHPFYDIVDGIEDN